MRISLLGLVSACTDVTLSWSAYFRHALQIYSRANCQHSEQALAQPELERQIVLPMFASESTSWLVGFDVSG